MPNFGRCIALIALAAAVFQTAPRAQSSQAADLFRQATAREAELRQAIETTPASSPKATDLIVRMRTLAHTYQDLWQLFPTSPYSADALWHGAMLAADAFWQAGDAADRATSLRLFQTLTAKFPTSSLAKRVPPEVSRLEAARAVEAPVTRTAQAPAPAPVTASNTPLNRVTAAPPAPVAGTPPVASPSATRATAPALSRPSALIAIRRQVLPDVLRVTLELEREPVFNSERIDGPPRLFIDMQNTRAAVSLTDARLAFPDDVVRQIRVGRQLNGRIRVVMDLSGAGKYSVYALYNPFRIVIDFDRKLTGTQPAVQRASNTPVVVAPPVPKAAAPSSSVGRVVSATADEPDKVRPATNVQPAAVTPPAARAPSTATVEVDKPRPTPNDVPRTTLIRGPEPGDAYPQPKAPPTSSVPTTVAPKPEVSRAAPTPAAGSTRPPATTSPVSPQANSSGAISLSRQLGLGIGRIVIDPGHGGHDPGAQVKGLSEAEITLDIALRLEKLFKKQPGVEVVLTRRDDSFVQLQERTEIANRAGADLFLSIHGNANDDTSLRGVETYFLNLSPNPEAGRLAARENASSSRTMHDMEDIVKAIALNDKIDESRDFAAMVQTSLYDKLSASNRNLRNLGVKQAPFVVLIGATMPSILAEISFLTNKQDVALLKTEKYRQQIAEALYQGVMRYQQSLKKAPAVASSAP